MKQRKRLKRASQTHYALFRSDLPFGHKVQRDQTKFRRHQKHRKNEHD